MSTSGTSVVNCVVSFACGILLAYAYQVYYVKRTTSRSRTGTPATDTANASVNPTEVVRLYEAIAAIEQQLDQIRHRLDRRRSGLTSQDELDASASASEPNCRPSEPADIFYDTSDSFDSSPAVGNRTDERQVYGEVDRLEAGASSETTLLIYESLKEHRHTLSHEADYWWRLAKASHLLSKTDLYSSADKKEARKALLYESFEFAKRALELDEQSGDCHKWYAITIGSLSDFVGTKERISIGGQFKSHLDMAMSLKQVPDPTLYHLGGRFCVELLALSWIELKLANTFFGALPQVSHREALDYFLKAHSLRPRWLENIFHIANIYLLSLKEPTRARAFIEQGLAIGATTQEEKHILRQLHELSKQCNA